MMLLYVAMGGAIGSALRYVSVSYSARLLGLSFPYGTLAVNVFGSLLMGVLAGFFAKSLPHNNELRAFLAVGVLGGFTTFSSFSLDTISLIEQGAWEKAALYVIASIVLAVGGLFVGLLLGRLA